MRIHSHSVLFRFQFGLFLLACCFPLFLFKADHTILKLLFYTLSVATIVQLGRKHSIPPVLNLFKHLYKDWLPFICSSLFFITFHGIFGNSYFINSMLILFLTSIGLSNFRFSRTWLACALSINLLALSILVLIHVYLYGVTTEIFGVNKNRIIPELTVLSSVLLMIWYSNRLSISNCLNKLILFSLLLNPIIVCITEVRTAILVYIFVLPLLAFSNRQKFLKFLPPFFGIVLLVVIFFILSGRAESGIRDIQLYLQGNPNSSWGIRIELWKLAFQGFLLKPLIGWGNDAFKLMIEYGLPYGVPNFQAESFHSDFFNLIATSGLLGVVGTYGTICLLIKNSSKDSVKLALIISSFAIGIPGQCWSANPTSLYIITLCWLLLQLSTPSDEKLRLDNNHA